VSSQTGARYNSSEITWGNTLLWRHQQVSEAPDTQPMQRLLTPENCKLTGLIRKGHRSCWKEHCHITIKTTCKKGFMKRDCRSKNGANVPQFDVLRIFLELILYVSTCDDGLLMDTLNCPVSLSLFVVCNTVFIFAESVLLMMWSNEISAAKPED
jgi:hypothetical protein